MDNSDDENKESTALHLGANSKISFNTYFNSFYFDYWAECASEQIRAVFVEITFSGQILVEVFNDRTGGGCGKVFETYFDGSTSTIASFKVDLFRTERGRLFFDIFSQTGAVIQEVSLRTYSKPLRNPNFTLGICTFNRESYLVKNLQAILREESLEDRLGAIFIVNQGKKFSNPHLLDLLSQSKIINVIEQGNFGGCGGFTRTMYEAITIPTSSHHILMDDDVVIDPRVLDNLANFLSYTLGDIVVGGHMLDLLRPTVLYEAGALVKPNSRIRSLHHNVDLQAPEAFIPFNKCHFSDYNAWWFCVIPRAHIEQVHFPAPIFIRGDDMEYGIRLQEKGARTVSMPGVAVWHEPFYVKVGGWQDYYDLRNRLIMASVYAHRFNIETPKNVIWWMMQALASHDYMKAALLTKAVQDFLKGPQLFETSAQTIHAEVAALAKSLAQPSVPDTDVIPRPRKLGRMPKSDFAISILVTRRIAAALLFGRKKGVKLLMDSEASLANIKSSPYVKTNGVGSYRLLYSPNRKRLAFQLVECFRTFREYVARKDEASTNWRAEISRWRTLESWKAIFEEDAKSRSPSIDDLAIKTKS